MSKYKTFVAYAKNSEGKPIIRITSVIAENEEMAREVVRHQLKKPGRGAYLTRWSEDGEVVEEDTN